MPTIDRDDTRCLLWHFGDRSEHALAPDRYEASLISGFLAATPPRYAALSRVAPSLAEAVGPATGNSEGFDRLVAIARGATPEDRSEPTVLEQAVAELYFHTSRFAVLKLTPEQREAYGDAVDKVFGYNHPGDFEPITRWWHEDYVPEPECQGSAHMEPSR
ncbi:hypothetical protein LG293_17355 (plasmid) [Citricoccus nitrophenolicus]